MHFSFLSKKYRNTFNMRTLFIIINLLIPLLFVLVTLFFYGKAIDDIIPVWGDEQWWWQQTNAVSVYGRPLGYWGYNGGTAQIGGFATWGAAATIPYGLFGMIFGWGYSSFVIANIFYQTIAILLFIGFTRPDKRGLAILCIINATQIIRNVYLFVCMQECVRSSIGIVVVGLIVWLYKNQDNMTNLKMFLIGLFLFIIGQIYLIWTGFFFPFFLIIHRQLTFRIRTMISLLETVFIVYISRIFMHLFTSPYFSNSLSLINRIKKNSYGLIELLVSPEVPFFFKLYIFGIVAVVVLVCVFVFIRKKELCRQDKIIIIFSCMIPIVFLFGHIILYNTTKWTFTRGMAMGIMSFAFILSFVNNKIPAVIVAVWGGICLMVFYANGIDQDFFNENRFRTKNWEDKIANTQLLMYDMTTELDKDISNNHWDYTIATYFVSPSPVAMSIPAGYSLNTMLDNQIRTDAKWIGIGKAADYEKSKAYVKEFTNNGYIISNESDVLVILKKEKER